MTRTSERSFEAAARLRAALDATVNALAVPNVDALLAAETALTAAFNDLTVLRAVSEDERVALRDELLAAQAALMRARRLGTSLSEVVRLSLQAHSHAAGYDPGRVAATALTGRGFQTRV